MSVCPIREVCGKRPTKRSPASFRLLFLYFCSCAISLHNPILPPTDRPRVPLGLRLPLHLDQDHTWTLPFILHCTLDSIPRQIIINPQVATNTSANTTHQLQPFYLKSATNSSQVAFSERFRGNETTQPPILSWVLVPMVIVSEHPVTTAVPRPILHELVFYIYSKNYRADKQRREQD